ncbi:MAG: respiratory nitrate reductase subunit gamma [Planctomycetota bacterium]|jgi:nitrate reductase gamma subunit
METLKFVVGVILPYIAIAVFLVGMIHRLIGWKKLASPPMTLFPAGSEEGSKTANILKEAFLFRSLIKSDRVLWVLAWAFHVVLALIFLGHFRVVANVDSILTKLGMSEESIQAMSGGVGGVAGVLIFLAAVLLLLRRLAVPRVKEVTGLGDYAILILLAAIIVTGNMMRFGGEHFDLGVTRTYFAGLASFSDVSSAAALDHGVFLVHMVMALVLIMLIPFSKILHLGGIFFTQHLIRKH